MPPRLTTRFTLYNCCFLDRCPLSLLASSAAADSQRRNGARRPVCFLAAAEGEARGGGGDRDRSKKGRTDSEEGREGGAGKGRIDRWMDRGRID